MPYSLKPGEATRLGFRAYNDTSEDLEVTVKVYQEYPVVKYIGSTTFTAYANSTTKYTSTIQFTMPEADYVILHAEFEATGIESGKKYSYGADWKIKAEEVTTPPDLESILLQDLQKWYKKNVEVPGVTEPYDWSFDVTEMVNRSGLYGTVSKAYLYGWYQIIDYSYAAPPGTPREQLERTPEEVVKGWGQGYELALLYIGADVYNIPPEYEGWYWVMVPCRLVVVGEPKASIVKDLSRYPDGVGGVIVNGSPVPVGTKKQVNKGATIEYFVMAENTGGEGTIWLRLLVNGVEVDRTEGSGIIALSGTLTANSDMEIKFEAGHGTVKDDEWGCGK